MDELQARHRKEQRDLQSRITQKKKQASKKTRKGVNDECERLETELHQRHQAELTALQHSGDGAPPEEQNEALSTDQLQRLTLQVDDDENNDHDDNAHVHNDLPSNHEKDSNGANNPATPTNAATITTPSPPPQGQTRKPNRQKARLARRAAEQAELAAQASVEADALPDRKAQERARILAAMSARNLHEIEIRADGHCLYSAVADQLTVLGIPLSPSAPPPSSFPSSLLSPSPSISTHTSATAKAVPPVSSDALSSSSPSQPTVPAYKVLRATTADYMLTHPDDFAPFLDEPLTPYAAKIRDTAEWGGQLELLALARAYGADIHVLQDFGRIERITARVEGEERKGNSTSTAAEAGTPPELWLGYYKHGFGLGEHYNSLRKEN